MSKKVLNILFGTLIVISIFCQIGHTAVPQKINFQGYITDSEGNPLDGTATMVLSIYDVDTGGTVDADFGELSRVVFDPINLDGNRHF